MKKLCHQGLYPFKLLVNVWGTHYECVPTSPVLFDLVRWPWVSFANYAMYSSCFFDINICNQCCNSVANLGEARRMRNFFSFIINKQNMLIGLHDFLLKFYCSRELIRNWIESNTVSGTISTFAPQIQLTQNTLLTYTLVFCKQSCF